MRAPWLVLAAVPAQGHGLRGGHKSCGTVPHKRPAQIRLPVPKDGGYGTACTTDKQCTGKATSCGRNVFEATCGCTSPEAFTVPSAYMRPCAQALSCAADSDCGSGLVCGMPLAPKSLCLCVPRAYTGATAMMYGACDGAASALQGFTGPPQLPLNAPRCGNADMSACFYPSVVRAYKTVEHPPARVVNVRLNVMKGVCDITQAAFEKYLSNVNSQADAYRNIQFVAKVLNSKTITAAQQKKYAKEWEDTAENRKELYDLFGVRYGNASAPTPYHEWFCLPNINSRAWAHGAIDSPPALIDGQFYGGGVFQLKDSIQGSYEGWKVFWHESGHVFGLYHPMQDVDEDVFQKCGPTDFVKCVPQQHSWDNGDYIPDTPVKSGDYCNGCVKCTNDIDTCKVTHDRAGLGACGSQLEDGVDHNIMTYTDETCRTMFSDVQRARMNCAVDAHFHQVLANDDGAPSMPIVAFGAAAAVAAPTKGSCGAASAAGATAWGFFAEEPADFWNVDKIRFYSSAACTGEALNGTALGSEHSGPDEFSPKGYGPGGPLGDAGYDLGYAVFTDGSARFIGLSFAEAVEVQSVEVSTDPGAYRLKRWAEGADGVCGWSSVGTWTVSKKTDAKLTHSSMAPAHDPPPRPPSWAGYRVYKDGKRVASLDAAATEWTDPAWAGGGAGATYTVTAVGAGKGAPESGAHPVRVAVAGGTATYTDVGSDSLNGTLKVASGTKLVLAWTRPLSDLNPWRASGSGPAPAPVPPAPVPPAPPAPQPTPEPQPTPPVPPAPQPTPAPAPAPPGTWCVGGKIDSFSNCLCDPKTCAGSGCQRCCGDSSWYDQTCSDCRCS